MIDLTKSKVAFEEARKFMPGGVNSPVRSYPHMGCPPPFIASAKGSHITDIDGNTYIDYVGSWGPMVLGHAHPAVIAAIQKAAERSTSYGAPTPMETEIAELIHEVYPSIEKLRMVNSGTEATMSALRAARGYTGRDKILNLKAATMDTATAFSSRRVPAQRPLAVRTVRVSRKAPQRIPSFPLIMTSMRSKS